METERHSYWMRNDGILGQKEVDKDKCPNNFQQINLDLKKSSQPCFKQVCYLFSHSD